MKQLICDSLNGMRITQIILATAICTPESESEVAQSCPTLCDPMDNRLLCPWDFLGKSTEVGCHFLLKDRDTSPLESAAAADLRIEFGEPPRASSVVECEDMSHRDLREEISVGNVCGRKSGSHGGKLILLSHTVGAAITVASLSLQASVGS